VSHVFGTENSILRETIKKDVLLTSVDVAVSRKQEKPNFGIDDAYLKVRVDPDDISCTIDTEFFPQWYNT
jgi:hypothetical protein